MDPNSNAAAAAAAAAAADEIEFEFFPFIRIYKSGRKERIIESDFLPAGLDTATDVLSKDVVISPDTAVSARLYLPNSSSLLQNDNENNKKKLPILIYFHGGGFVIETAFSPTYHPYLNSLVSKSNVLAVSVDYRRLPDHPLPAAYDDCWSAIQWVASAADPWLADHGDFARLFMAGDSAGANIAHRMAVRAGAGGLPQPRINGIVLVHPYFWGVQPVGSEKRSEEGDKGMVSMWRLICPETSGLDDPWLNPWSEAGPGLGGLECERVMVSVAEKDLLRERGRAYYERLKGSGWKGVVEFYETEGENHVYYLRAPGCDKAAVEMERLAAFLNSE